MRARQRRERPVVVAVAEWIPCSHSVRLLDCHSPAVPAPALLLVSLMSLRR